MLMVETESSRSSSSAPMTGAAAMIALVPQMAVPQPTSIAVWREVFIIRPASTAAAHPQTMEARITASDGAPTRATSARFTLAPVRMMVNGITRLTSPLQSSTSAAGSGTVLRMMPPSTMARIAELSAGTRKCRPKAMAATVIAARSPWLRQRGVARMYGRGFVGCGSSIPSMESSEAYTSALIRLW